MAFLSAMTARPESTRAAEVTAPDCPAREIQFDGIERLEYATIKADSSGRLAFYNEYPGSCAGNESARCTTRAYLIDGDDVAIGKVCDPWAYVQYIGEKRISVGWISANNLARAQTSAAAPAPPLPAGGQSMTTRYRAMLLKGQSVPVCEAYLQRLNQTDFRLPPFCGRPESTTVPGFAFLNRVWVETSEINRVEKDVVNFIDDQPLNSGQGSVPFPLAARLATYRYEPGLAIENDGTARDVWMWNLDRRDNGECGTTFGPIPYVHRASQVPLILTEGGTKLDREATRSAFGQPLSGTALPGDSDQIMHNAGYAQLGNTYGIFEYRGVFYFDTFFDNGPNALEHIVNATGPNILENRLGVFVRHQRRTAEMCEYQVDQ